MEITVSQLTSKYVDEEYIKNVGCFMQGCKGRSLYVLQRKGYSDVFHCHLHKGRHHKRIKFT